MKSCEGCSIRAFRCHSTCPDYDEPGRKKAYEEAERKAASEFPLIDFKSRAVGRMKKWKT